MECEAFFFGAESTFFLSPTLTYSGIVEGFGKANKCERDFSEGNFSIITLAEKKKAAGNGDLDRPEQNSI